MLAVSRCETELVKALIERGADIDAKDKNGSTVLMKTIDNCCVEEAQILIEAGAGVRS